MSDQTPAVIVVESEGDTVVVEIGQPISVIDVVDLDHTQVVEIGNLGGGPGPQGPPGQWDALTQTEYNALPSKDPNTLYVIIN